MLKRPPVEIGVPSVLAYAGRYTSVRVSRALTNPAPVQSSRRPPPGRTSLPSFSVTVSVSLFRAVLFIIYFFLFLNKVFSCRSVSTRRVVLYGKHAFNVRRRRVPWRPNGARRVCVVRKTPMITRRRLSTVCEKPTIGYYCRSHVSCFLVAAGSGNDHYWYYYIIDSTSRRHRPFHAADDPYTVIQISRDNAAGVLFR